MEVSTNSKSLSFEQTYKDCFGEEPNLFAPEAYDAVMLIAKELKKIKAVNPVNLHTALYSVSDYQGASGALTFDKNGDVMKPLVIKEIVDGSVIIKANK